MIPLAERLRATKIEDVVGQKHLIGKGKVLTNLIEKKECVNMIFYGPSGVGKTTVANIIAKNVNKTLYKLNATTASIKDIHEIAQMRNTLDGMNGILLYLDEIQNFNKKQQQALLEYVERGDITLIASTTENPYFYIYGALLSRCVVFEFKKIEDSDIEEFLSKKVKELDYEVEDMAIKNIAYSSGGDIRRSLNILDIAMITKSALSDDEAKKITNDDICNVLQNKFTDYDKNGNSHYDYLSAFQKSIRGSDPNAAIHYLARLIEVGDLISICRRLLVMAAEDVGLAHPQAIVVVKACCDAAKEVGFPEARIPLAEAVIFLATLPKSNSAESAIDAALTDLTTKEIGEIPKYIRDEHTSMTKSKTKYKYPHSYPNHYVKQTYLPKGLEDTIYYDFGTNKYESGLRTYWDEIKKNSK